jgi:ParB/RepB/Spo0J family partition protein
MTKAEVVALGSDVVRLIPVAKIRPNLDQPRIEFDEDKLHLLRVSIKTEGQLVPVFLKPVNDQCSVEDGVEYELIDGERRWRAALMDGSGIEFLKAIVLACDEKEQFLKSCALNFNREGHTPYEEIHMAWKLVEVYKHPLNYVANMLGKSTFWVSQRVLAYKRLAPEVLEEVKTGNIPVTVATTLSKLLHVDQLRELDYYKRGGSVGDVAVAVRAATDTGRVQGGVRKPDMKDDRRYVLKSADGMLNRFHRHRAMGDLRLRAVAASMSKDERERLIQRLMTAGKEIVNLMKILKQEGDD